MEQGTTWLDEITMILADQLYSKLNHKGQIMPTKLLHRFTIYA